MKLKRFNKRVEEFRGKRLVEILKGWNDLKTARLFLDIPRCCDSMTEWAYQMYDTVDDSTMYQRRKLYEAYEYIQLPFIEANPSACWEDEIVECERWLCEIDLQKRKDGTRWIFDWMEEDDEENEDEENEELPFP